MHKLLAACALVLVALPFGAAGADKIDCDNAMNQHDMNMCAAQSFSGADAKLNRIYRDLVSKLEEKDKAQLRTAQKAWLAFRDAECTYTIRQNEGGSIYPMMWSGCLHTMTDKRIKELQAHLDCENGKDSCTE